MPRKHFCAGAVLDVAVAMFGNLSEQSDSNSALQQPPGFLSQCSVSSSNTR